MLRMVSYPRRPKSGHITCYLNRTYHVLTTIPAIGACLRHVPVIKVAGHPQYPVTAPITSRGANRWPANEVAAWVWRLLMRPSRIRVDDGLPRYHSSTGGRN